jgi:hypothetical protein
MPNYNYKNIAGQTFGRLTAVAPLPERAKGRRSLIWLCKCTCGNETHAIGTFLRSGQIKTCGCGKKEYGVTHGDTHSDLYQQWTNMRGRCRPNIKKAHLYYDKGIRVCEDWQQYEGFKKDMGATYQSGLSLDRIDNSKGYTKDNCRWVTFDVQCYNRSNVTFVEHEGQSLPIKTWCKKLGINSNHVYAQMKKGCDIKCLLWPNEYELTQ